MLSFVQSFGLIEIGKFHDLEILRITSVGLFLGLEDEEEEILLPNKYCPKDYSTGDFIKVFVYRDYMERKIATNIIPKIKLNEFALLQVVDVAEVGAFLDWGLEKNLFVPFKEQRQNLEQDRWYVVYMTLDEETDRLYASNKLSKFLQNEALTVDEGEKVELVIMRKTDLGYLAIIDHMHEGLIYQNEIFKELRIGDKLTGYIKTIREDNKIDISLQPIGFENYKDDNVQKILDTLVENQGHISLNDKSSPGEIYALFGISKKAFKKAIGNLYKLRKITIEKDGIKLIDNA